MHRTLGQLVHVTNDMDWAYPVNGLKYKGRQLYRLENQGDLFIEDNQAGEFSAYFTDCDEVGDLSWASERVVDEAVRNLLETQVREE